MIILCSVSEVFVGTTIIVSVESAAELRMVICRVACGEFCSFHSSISNELFLSLSSSACIFMAHWSLSCLDLAMKTMDLPDTPSLLTTLKSRGFSLNSYPC